MLTALATALALTLDAGSGTAAPPQPAWAPPSSVTTLSAERPLRSALWLPAGAYGMAMTFAGGASILTEFSTRASAGRNVKPPLIAMGLGLLAGALPGYWLGELAREEENTKARGAIGVLDLVGSAAVFFAFRQIYRGE